MPISSGACGVPNKYWNTPGQQAGNGAKWPSAREVNQGHRQGYPPHNPHSPPPPYRQEQEPQSGCCGRKSRTHHSQTRSHNNEGYRRGCCGPNAMYTTGVAGAGAGCCTGGMFGSRVSHQNRFTINTTKSITVKNVPISLSKHDILDQCRFNVGPALHIF